ncbi:MAG: mannosyltransferase family protein [Acidimicrobiales bacterium]
MSVGTARHAGARTQWALAVPALRASAAPFLVSRALVLLALLGARIATSEMHLGAAARHASYAGLLSWDASWYERIAAHGYAGLGTGALRFFPLLPVLARSLRALPGVTAGMSVVFVANAAAFGAFVVLYRLVSYELGDEACAHRAVWLLALAPPAFVLVMGYADSLLLLASIAAFLGIRQRRYTLAIVAAFLAGLCRPVGVLLAIPAAVELGANWFALSGRERVKAAGTVLAAPLGTAAYLVWVQEIFGSFWLPLREQLEVSHRGALTDPLLTVAHDIHDLVHGSHLGVAEHGLWAVLFVLLALYVLKNLPAAYAWYVVAFLAVALTAANLSSLERYGLGCFPFVVAGAMLTKRASTYRIAAGLCGVLLVTLAMLAFLGIYVP